MDTLLHDLRLASRTLVKHPGFTFAAVVTLALGVGVNTAVFSVVDGVMLRPLPYPEPERVVYLVRELPPPYGQSPALNGFKYDYYRRNTTVFEAMALHEPWATEIGEGDVPEEARGLRASAGFFDVNGIQPALGRAFSADEDVPGAAPVVVISDALWRARFGADPGVLGRTIRLGGEAHTIVGVMPADFRFPEAPASTDFVVPYRLDPDIRNLSHVHRGRARLRAGVSREAALAELAAVSARLREDHPEVLGENVPGLRFTDFTAVHVGNIAAALWLLLGTVTFVLLIACANVASLLLARSAARQRELAIRAAIGAGRGRLARQLLTESLLLALIAAGVGLLVGQWTLDLMLALAPGDLPRADEIGLDARVLGFTLGIAVLSGVLFGSAAALQVGRGDLNRELRDAGARSTRGRAGRRVLSSIAAGEVAVAVVLLAGAGLLIASFAELTRADPGFEPDGVYVAQFPRTPDGYTPAQVWSFERQALERIRALPGVTSAAVTSLVPLRGQINMPISVVGRPEASGSVQYRAISSEYFDALRVPMTRGRRFVADDEAAQAAPVVIVNDAFARAAFGDANPLGERVEIGAIGGVERLPGFDDPVREIVGVVADMQELGLGTSPSPTVYVPRAQLTGSVGRLGAFVIRAEAEAGLASSVLGVIREVDPRVPAPEWSSMIDVVGISVAQPRFYTVLLSVFAGLALTLAAIGIYGVVTFTVRQRTDEIGIRSVLGGDPRGVLALVLRQALVPVLIGLGIGLAAALVLTRLLRGLLFGVDAADPATLGAAALSLLAVAFVAIWIPARRAARVDPLIALRNE
ncbi:MAG TPA: ABC transporter permease [Gammaproteobacteria bacterium]